ncbi:TPA: peptide deformylase [Aeromonas salmonicida]|nr:peptide deformylase [Aeromonas salmonicida]
MAILDILTAPDIRLKIKSVQVNNINYMQKLIDDMLETIYATENGIGLAATQVWRIIDLSKSAFGSIANIRDGIIKVKVL